MKIGIQELLLVFIVALVVLGPDKLPVYAKKLGQAFAQFRKFSEDATKDIRESIVEPLEEAQRPLKEAMEPITELERDVRNNVNGIKKSLNSIGSTPKKDVEKESAVPEADHSLDSSGTDTEISSPSAPAAAPQPDSAASSGETEEGLAEEDRLTKVNDAASEISAEVKQPAEEPVTKVSAPDSEHTV